MDVARRTLTSTARRKLGGAFFSTLGAAYRLVTWSSRPNGIRPVDAAALKSVLVVNLLRIGDSVVALPAIHALRAAAPEARITAFVQPPIVPLYEPDPAIDEVATEESSVQGRRFDLALVLDVGYRGNLIAWKSDAKRRIGYDSFGRGFLLTDSEPAPSYWNTPVWDYPPGNKVRHQVDSWLHLVEAAGLPVEERAPRLTLSENGRAYAEEFWRFNGVENAHPRVAIHPGSSPSYEWEMDRFRAVAEAIVERHGAIVIVTGGRQDKVAAEWICERTGPEVIDATGTELDEFVALIAGCDLVISVDTCATHIGAALGVPVVALFGPGDPDIWRPYGPAHEVLRAEDCGCLGCKRAECIRDKHLCMDGISVESVIGAAERLLARGAKRT